MKFQIKDLEHKDPKKRNSKQILVRLIGLILGLSLLVWFIAKSDIRVQDVVSYLKIMNWKFVFVLGITFLAYLIASLAWQQCFYVGTKFVNLFKLFSIRLVGESLAQINPSNIVAGETLKAYLLKQIGYSYKDSIVSLTISRFLMLFSGITLISIGLIIFIDDIEFIKNKSIVYISLIAVLLLFSRIIFLLHKGKGLLYLFIGILKKLSRIFPTNKTLVKAIDNSQAINKDLTEFYKHRKANFIAAFFLSLIHWIFGAFEYYIILTIFNIDVSILSCIGIEIGIMGIKAATSFVPGQIGVEEYGNKFMLDFVGIQDTGQLWIMLSLIRRLRQVIWIGIGFMFFILIIRKAKNTENGNIVHNT